MNVEISNLFNLSTLPSYEESLYLENFLNEIENSPDSKQQIVNIALRISQSQSNPEQLDHLVSLLSSKSLSQETTKVQKAAFKVYTHLAKLISNIGSPEISVCKKLINEFENSLGKNASNQFQHPEQNRNFNELEASHSFEKNEFLLSIPQPKAVTQTLPKDTQNSRGLYLDSYLTDKMKTLHARWDKFSKCHIVGDHSIVWMVTNHGDGFGDLSNCLKAIEIVRKKYPTWQHRLLIDNAHAKPIPFDLQKEGFSDTQFLIRNTSPLLKRTNLDSVIQKKINNFSNKKNGRPERYLEKDSKDINPNENNYYVIPISDDTIKVDEFLNFFENSDLQISVSTTLDNLFDPYDGFHVDPKYLESSTTNHLSFSEYGESLYHKCKFNMGLSGSSCGIFIIDPVIKDHFSNPELNKIFSTRKNIYFNYGQNLKSYINLVNNLNPNSSEINIICKEETISEIKKLEGVAKIIFVKNNTETTIVETNEPGKVIYLIDPFPLEHEDMLKAMHMSQEPVGVTGNCTFSESLNRLPFYNNRNVLANFWQGLISLCEKTSSESVELINYLKSMQHDVQDTRYVKKIKITPENLLLVKQQWTKFINIVKTDWDVSVAYVGEINYQLHLKDPSKLMQG